MYKEIIDITKNRNIVNLFEAQRNPHIYAKQVNYDKDFGRLKDQDVFSWF